MLRATVHGNGPFTPVVIYNDRLFVLGNRFADMADALAEATAAVAKIRDDMRWSVERDGISGYTS